MLQSDSPAPTPKSEPDPGRPTTPPRSAALEAELAMLEAILPHDTEGAPQPPPVDPASDRGESR